MSDQHFCVDKPTINQGKGKKANNHNAEQRTVIRVTTLDNLTTRREELAQLAAGKSASDAIAFAQSLLSQAANHRRKEQN